MSTTYPLALVTGGAHRLGKTFALTLARLGYAVLVHYHTSAQAAAETVDQICALGVPGFALQANLTEPAEIEALFDAIDALNAGTLQVLVNSAALMPPSDVLTLSAAQFDSTLALNLRAPLLCAQQAAPRMTGGGLIVNISDVGAGKAWIGFPAYSVSKAGLESLTKILARAFAPQIRVNALAPGLVFPSAEMPAEQWQRLVARLPLPRPATPQEIGAALEFLIKNEYITGQTLTLDGGYSLL